VPSNLRAGLLDMRASVPRSLHLVHPQSVSGPSKSVCRTSRRGRAWKSSSLPFLGCRGSSAGSSASRAGSCPSLYRRVYLISPAKKVAESLIASSTDPPGPTAVRGLKRLLHVSFPREAVRTGLTEVSAEEPVPVRRGLQLVVGPGCQGQLKALESCPAIARPAARDETHQSAREITRTITP